MNKTKAYSAASSTAPLIAINIQRRAATEHDVQI